MRVDARHCVAAACLAVIGVCALLPGWFADRRPVPVDDRADREFTVTSGADRGAGSLREALFGAASAGKRARIVLRAPRIEPRSPLPPVVNPEGVLIEAEGPGIEIDARALAGGPVIDVDSRNSILRGFSIRGAPEQAVLARAQGLRLSEMRIEGSDEAVHVAEGLRSVLIDGNEFVDNRIGIRLATSGNGVLVRDNRFSGHQDAAVWAVGSRFEGRGAGAIALRDNWFSDDRVSLVLGNAAVQVENNEFERARDSAVYLVGEGAVVRGNRIRNGSGSGVIAQGVHGAVIENNELDHLAALAILVRGSRDILVRRNRLHHNGYGIAFVLGEAARPGVARENVLLAQRYDGIVVIGDSPVLRDNRVLTSRQAGLRLLEFVPLDGRRVAAEPLMLANVWDGNGQNDAVRGTYLQTRAEARRP